MKFKGFYQLIVIISYLMCVYICNVKLIREFLMAKVAGNKFYWLHTMIFCIFILALQIALVWTSKQANREQDVHNYFEKKSPDSKDNLCIITDPTGNATYIYEFGVRTHSINMGDTLAIMKNLTYVYNLKRLHVSEDIWKKMNISRETNPFLKEIIINSSSVRDGNSTSRLLHLHNLLKNQFSNATIQVFLDEIPLISSAIEKYSNINLSQLIREQAHVNAKDFRSRTPLFYAVLRGDINIVVELLNHGAIVDAQDATGLTALIVAVHGRNYPIAKKLVEAGANPNLSEQHGFSAMNFAIFSKDLIMLEMMLDFDGDPNHKDQVGKCLLEWAIRDGYKKAIILLIMNGAKVNSVNNAGFTLVDVAEHSGFNSLSQLLVQFGATRHVNELMI